MLCVSFLATVTYISRIFCFCFSFLCWSAEVEKGTYFNFAGALNAVYLSRHVSMNVWESFFFFANFSTASVLSYTYTKSTSKYLFLAHHK